MLLTLLVSSIAADSSAPLQISGIYPHLAVYNHAMECGIGVVMPWADRPWFMTYPPHEPEGGEDKLYYLDADLTRHVHPESPASSRNGMGPSGRPSNAPPG